MKRKYERVLQDLGFYDTETVYHSHSSPREVATRVLTKAWQMKPEDKDVLVMRITTDDGKRQYAADVFAEHNGYSAMALTTGGMAAIATRALIERKFEKEGAYPLENAIKLQPCLMSYLIAGLKSLGVRYTQTSTTL